MHLTYMLESSRTCSVSCTCLPGLLCLASSNLSIMSSSRLSSCDTQRNRLRSQIYWFWKRRKQLRRCLTIAAASTKLRQPLSSITLHTSQCEFYIVQNERQQVSQRLYTKILFVGNILGPFPPFKFPSRYLCWGLLIRDRALQGCTLEMYKWVNRQQYGCSISLFFPQRNPSSLACSLACTLQTRSLKILLSPLWSVGYFFWQ